MFLNQKATILAMKCNDENSHYFNSSIKARRAQNKVLTIKDHHGVTCSDNQAIENAFLAYYTDLLGSSKEVVRMNATVVTLIPKKEVPDTVIDYRAIACCNVLSSAYLKYFVLDWLRYSLTSYALIKVPDQMVTWIMQCVTTPYYTLALNGSHFGGLGLCHLAFADDLLLFSRGDTNSVRILMRALHTFSIASGLTINKIKSDIYINGMTTYVEAQILSISGFKKGSFPFTYLRVDISYKRLTNHQCNKLVDKMELRIHSWGEKQLSYAGRLMLVKTVLTQLHCYWARIYLIPKGVIHKVDSICRNYLWSGNDGYHRVPAVSWDNCCQSKINGGLGINNCHVWNIASIGKYTRWVANKKDSLWVKWVHQLYIKQQDWNTAKHESRVPRPVMILHQIQNIIKFRLQAVGAENYKEWWDKEVNGTPMFKLVSKLKALKFELKKLNKEQFSDIENLIHVAELSLKQFQEMLVMDPFNEQLT
ncbi:uncharacterized protein LOC141630645 [Silene latifolia]|uniref:uncharacterized protein LOC141630645 n=1 Tax=Silene latifolia TaxID=37657 RepID=UPI003D77154B